MARQIYYGWFVVIAATVIFMLVIGITTSAFGLFVVPVSRDFGLSRADTNSAMVIMLVASGIGAPLAGRLLDLVSFKVVTIVSSLMLAAGLVGLGLSHSIVVSAALIAILVAVGTLGSSTIPINILIARWFSARRGRALALAQTGMSLTGVVVVPIVGFMIEGLGWRRTLIYFGIATGIVLVTFFACVRTRPGPDDHELGRPADGDAGTPAPLAQPVPALGWKAILLTPAFWTLVIGSSIAMAVSQAILVTITPMALDVGFTPARATGLVAFIGIGATSGSLLIAAIADRLDRLTAISLLLVALALLIALPFFSQSYAVLALVCVGVGFGAMATSVLLYALLADMFGLAAFGTVQGLMAPVMTIVIAIALRFSGGVFDRTESYDLIFPIFAAAEIVAAALVLATRAVARGGHAGG
ncbi:MAG TPA: MFS transporter [Novosphingobium sp.]|nr:MFS transporter [Novosphingobium sp.]